MLRKRIQRRQVLMARRRFFGLFSQLERESQTLILKQMLPQMFRAFFELSRARRSAVGLLHRGATGSSIASEVAGGPGRWAMFTCVIAEVITYRPAWREINSATWIGIRMAIPAS